MSSATETVNRIKDAAAAGGYALDTERPPEQLVGGASPRQYWRCILIGYAQPVIAMVSPQEATASEHGASADDELARWVGMRDTLASRGVAVPVVVTGPHEGVAFVEDLGDVRIFERWQKSDPLAGAALYRGAAALLVDFQEKTAGLKVGPSLGRAAMAAELEEFRAMGLERRHGFVMTSIERGVWDKAVAAILAPLADSPQVLAHRDFQSQNIMDTERGLVLIDFQDAFMAPAAYDWVALLRDSYVALPGALLAETLGYASATVRDLFPYQTLQRKLKDAGRFVTLAERGKPWFLQWYPRTIGYVAEALVETGAAPDLLDLLRTRVPELGT